MERSESSKVQYFNVFGAVGREWALMIYFWIFVDFLQCNFLCFYGKRLMHWMKYFQVFRAVFFDWISNLFEPRKIPRKLLLAVRDCLNTIDHFNALML